MQDNKKPLPLKGTYVAQATGVVQQTTPVFEHRTTKTVAIDLAPGVDTARVLLAAATAALAGRRVLLTARDRKSALVLHAAKEG